VSDGSVDSSREKGSEEPAAVGRWRSKASEAWRIANDPREWPALAHRVYAASPRYLLLVVSFVYENFSSFVARLLWTSAGLVIAAIIVQGLMQHVTVIEPLSVPKALADRGYSSDVAAQRFRDAMTGFAASVNTHMKQSEVALHAELPNIVVPTVGISLDAVMASVRTLFRSTRSQSLGGEFTIDHDQLWLRLGLNGLEFYSSKQGGDPEKPDELLIAAVPEAMKKTQPYFLAVSLSDRNDLDGALSLIDWITSSLPEHDENVAWAYNLKGSILVQQKDYPAAEVALQKSLALAPKLAAAHVNLGRVREKTERLNDAVAECREAIKLDPQYSIAHNNLGQYLKSLGKTDEAIQEYREAARLDPHDPLSRTNLGVALRSLRRDDEAILGYRDAIRVNPTFSLAHYDLAIVLAARGDFSEAVTESREAIRYDPKNSRAYNNLGNALRELGRTEDAIAAFREAVKLDPKFTQAHVNLGRALSQIGKADDAKIEFQQVLTLDPNNVSAVDYLKGSSDLDTKSN
jgi:tetratricopeptide (TPR) repeat protein